MFLRLCLLAVTLGLTFSFVPVEAECGPGFVSASCEIEKQRLDKINCSLVSTVDVGPKDSEDNRFDPPTGEPLNTVDESPDCPDLVRDLEDCKAQCIPKVTNGSILPGPADGSQARGYVLQNFIPNLTNSFLVFNMIMGTLLLVIAGFMWIFSSGNPELAKRARDTAIWTILGVTVGVVAYLLVQLVININFFA